VPNPLWKGVSMIKVLILEDEEYTRKFIKEIVGEIPLISEVFDTSKGVKAIELAKKFKPDIALLDIELSIDDKINGLETAKIILNICPNIRFIFVTGYTNYALDSFVVHPYDYILKPINVPKLRETISSLAATIHIDHRETDNKDKRDRIIIRNKKEMFFIRLDEILFAEKFNKEVLIHVIGNTYKAQQTLSGLEEMLNDDFIRVHKSFIVNKNKISRVCEISNRAYEIGFEESEEVAFMSRYKAKEFFDSIS
jgi:two-component system LytT family response regulator